MNEIIPVNKAEYRAGVAVLQQMLKEFPQCEMKLEHHFAHGTYTRLLHMPEGVVVIGKIHRNSCTNMLLKGRVKVVSDDGMLDIEAPYIGVFGSDVKKSFYAVKDSIWATIHPWDGEMDLEQIEQAVINSEGEIQCPM